MVEHDCELFIKINDFLKIWILTTWDFLQMNFETWESIFKVNWNWKDISVRSRILLKVHFMAIFVFWDYCSKMDYRAIKRRKF